MEITLTTKELQELAYKVSEWCSKGLKYVCDNLEVRNRPDDPFASRAFARDKGPLELFQKYRAENPEPTWKDLV